MQPKQTFIFNVKWRDALAGYTPDVRLEVYEAVINYAATGVQPSDLQPLSRMAFDFIKQDIDGYKETYAATLAKRRAAGRAGGRPKKREAKEEQPTPPVEEPKQEQVEEPAPVETPAPPENQDPVADTPAEPAKVKTPRVMVRPTFEEVAAYFKEKQMVASPQEFFDYYTSNGWMVGRTPMKDWRAAARRWNATDINKGRRPAVQVAPQTAPDYSFKGGFGGQDT